MKLFDYIGYKGYIFTIAYINWVYRRDLVEIQGIYEQLEENMRDPAEVTDE